jgi:hypothetical protein
MTEIKKSSKLLKAERRAELQRQRVARMLNTEAAVGLLLGAAKVARAGAYETAIEEAEKAVASLRTAIEAKRAEESESV